MIRCLFRRVGRRRNYDAWSDAVDIARRGSSYIQRLSLRHHNLGIPDPFFFLFDFLLRHETDLLNVLLVVAHFIDIQNIRNEELGSILNDQFIIGREVVVIGIDS